MSYLIRPEVPGDFLENERLTRAAFWDVYQPGCTEHFILHNMRRVPGFIPALSLVAEAEGRLVGNIVYIKGSIQKADGTQLPVLGFGPLSVLPACQKQGIGAALVTQSLEIATAMGYPAVLIYGSPAYYSRFSFIPAQNFGISTPDGSFIDALMALELQPGALSDAAGRFLTDPVYEVDPDALAAYEKSL